MTGAQHTTLPHRSAPTTTAAAHHGSDQDISESEEDSAGVHIGRSGAQSRESSVEDYTEESEASEEEDTWTDVSKELGTSESASRPSSSAQHHRLTEVRHRPRREEQEARLQHRVARPRRQHQISPASVDSIEEQLYSGPPADLAVRQGDGYYQYPPGSVQGQPYRYAHASPGYAQPVAHYQQPGMPHQGHVMPYGPQQHTQYPFAYGQGHPQAQYPFPPAPPRMASGYGQDMGYGTAQQAYNPYPQYQPISNQIAAPPIVAPQPIHYHYQPVYTPPPPNPTPPAAPPPAAPAPAPVASNDPHEFERIMRFMEAERQDREAREAKAKKDEEEKLAAATAATKRAEEIAKAANEATETAKTEAEKKAAEEKKKLVEEAEAAAAKAKTELEEAVKKLNEEKEAAVKAAEAAAAAAAAVPAEKQKAIKFKDAVGRKFSFPFHLCKTWEGMEDLIRQAFLHVDLIGPHVVDGHYDLMGPNGEIILPAVWETVIEPDWTITMHMWPMPEKEEVIDVVDVPMIPDPLPPEDKKKSKKPVKKSGFFSFGGPPPKAKKKASVAAAAAAAAKK